MVSGMSIASSIYIRVLGFQYLECLALWMNVKTLLTMACTLYCSCDVSLLFGSSACKTYLL